VSTIYGVKFKRVDKEIKQIKEKIQRIIDNKRLSHTLSVEKTAVELAKLYGADEKKVRIAALLHDCAKNLPQKELLKIARKEKIKIDKYFENNAHLLHGPIGALIAKRNFKIKDKEILEAIKNHTTGRPNMSLIEEIIYLADHIEPNRNYKHVKAIRSTAKKNIHKTIALVSTKMLEYLLRKKREIYPSSIETRNYYLRKSGLMEAKKDKH